MFSFLRKSVNKEPPSGTTSNPIREAEKNNTLQTIDGTVILQHDQRRVVIAELRNITGLNQHQFDVLYYEPLVRYADFVQGAPASEHHHHAYRFGLIDHTLEAIIYGLRKRSGVVLPRGVSAEDSAALRDIYTYAIFVSILMHDVAKPITDLVYKYSDGQLWNPFNGTLGEQGINEYTIHFNGQRQYSNHSSYASILLIPIIGAEGMSWLLKHPNVITDVVTYLNNTNARSDIAFYAAKGDTTSVQFNMGGCHKNDNDSAPVPTDTRPEFTTKTPLHEHLVTSLRDLITRGTLPINREGAALWFLDDANDFCWGISKRIVDSVREDLTIKGISGVPGDNSRLFDILMEYGYAVATPDNKVIHKGFVSIKDRWTSPMAFSLLKLRTDKIYPNKEQQPQSIEGSVELHNNKSETVIEPKSTSAKETKESGPSVTGQTPDLNIPATQLFDFNSEEDPSKAHSYRSVINDNTKEQANEQTRGDENSMDAYHPLITWLRDNISKGVIRFNTKNSFVHITDLGVFLLSPRIFEVFAEHSNIANWRTVQRDFQSAKLNIKTSNDENVWKFIIKGRTKRYTVNGWIIPIDMIFEIGTSPPTNEHLALK